MITFGIISTAQIAHRFIKGASFCDQVRIKAVASRTAEKAQKFASSYQGMLAYGSYEALFLDQEIDAVYIATPNFSHKELILQALSYGKHVLCEKPLLLHEADVRECFAYAKAAGLVLMEAMKPCFLPTTNMVRKWLKEKAIGDLRYVEASYCHGNITPFTAGWHHHLKLGGGVLYDIGVYPIGFIHGILPQPLSDVTCHRRMLDGCDIYDEIHANYGDATIHLLCACDMAMENQALLVGTKGYIRVVDFWKSEAAQLHNEQGVQLFEDHHHKSEFRYEIQSFCDTLDQHLAENPIMNEQMSLRNAALVDLVQKEGIR